MKFIDEYKNTENNSVYNKAKKRLLSNGVLGKTTTTCDRCQYHKDENKGRKEKYPKKSKKWSWKKLKRNLKKINKVHND